MLAKTSITLPKDSLLWLKGYAKARGVPVSRVISDLLVEKKAELKTEAKQDAIVREIKGRILA